MRMTRVIFGAKSSPFLLAATVKHHLKQYEASHPLACKMLNDCLYVDDLISGAESETEARKMMQQTTELLASATMNLRRWRSNCTALQAAPKIGDTRIKDIITTDRCPTIPKVLGLNWNTETDKLGFDTTSLLKFLVHKKDTKRNVLQATARLYDPMGFLTPFTIRIKCLFQVLWERGVGWDNELPPDLRVEWNKWNQELTQLQEISIPRSIFISRPCSPDHTQIHCFSDASTRAYGAVIYARYQTESGEIKTSFIISKARVAPLKRISLPRLELLGALLAARLCKQAKDVFDKRIRVFMWTDSMIVYHWVREGARRWKQFVSNRISEIQSLTEPATWSHCPGSENPADPLTRGLGIGGTKASTLWWHGPQWLIADEEYWPTPVHEPNVLKEVERELRKSETVVQTTCTTESEPMLDLEKFGTIRRVLRVTSWVNRFISNSKGTRPKISGPLNDAELWEAEKYWIKWVQQQEFGREMIILKDNQTVRGSKIKDLEPFTDKDGLLRARSRLQEASLEAHEKQPYILPTKVRLRELLVRAAHERLMNSGLNETLSQLREIDWIVKGRRFVKSIKMPDLQKVQC